MVGGCPVCNVHKREYAKQIVIIITNYSLACDLVLNIHSIFYRVEEFLQHLI